jgi:hypothetical protein
VLGYSDVMTWVSCKEMVTYSVFRDLMMYSLACHSVRIHMQVSVIRGVIQAAAIMCSSIDMFSYATPSKTLERYIRVLPFQ